MTAEQVLHLHSEDFNRALTQQDYHALERIYSERYMLVRPDGFVLNKQQVLKDLREQLRIHTIELEGAAVRVVGPVAILTAASTTVSSRTERNLTRIFDSLPSTARRAAKSVWSTFEPNARCERRRRGVNANSRRVPMSAWGQGQ